MDQYINAKGLIFNTVHGSFVDGPGIRTTIFLKGCPLAITRMMVAKLRKALKQLTEDEMDLIDAIYFQELSERKYAAILGISQKGVNKRRHKILSKLKKIIENN